MAKSLELPSGAKSVKFSPDGKQLLIGCLNGTVKLWDIQTGRVSSTLRASGGKESRLQLYRVAFAPDGKTIAAAGRVQESGQKGTGRIWMWNVKTGVLLHTLQRVSPGIYGLDFSPDGKTLASATLLKMYLWDVQTGELLKSWEDENGFHSIAFTSDGKYLATGGKGGESHVTADGTWDSNVHGTVKLWPIQ